MKNIKKTILNLLAKAGMNSAIKAAGAASSMGYCQPKEPEALKKLIRS
ncbi:MAG: cyclic lactone autoinducer peptide [Oscillospiraceae bacterium]|jgi:cyclic lactone autoinducer peptide|nr:cyclic lactone autoinducer peptide [Oscillospiraceae bacterium]